MTPLALTLVIIAYNEAAVIGHCLDSVPFAAEKLVIDAYSTDDTVAVATRHGARVVQQAWLGFGPQRNFATTQCSQPWILALDADETLSPELAAELAARLPALLASGAAGAWLRRRTIYMGRAMRWYRPAVGEKLARLYHRDRARWTDARVHESLILNGEAPTFDAPFNHANNPTLVHKQLKVLRYAELKCRDWNDANKPVRMWQAPFVYALAFFKDYVLRLAMFDGWRGFMVAQTAASYALYKRMRYYEMRQHPPSVERARQQLENHQLDR